MRRKLKRLAAPKFWRVGRKTRKWVVSPSPGPHKKSECFPLLLIVRDILKLAENAKDAKKIINKGEIFVDNKARKDYAFPVGLFDVVSIPRLKKFYRVVPSLNGLKIFEISEEESKLKICRIEGKRVIKGGKIQLNLHDGRNLLTEKNGFSVGDSLLLEIPSQKILSHIKLEKDCLGVITKGKNSGKIGKVLEIIPGKALSKPKIICEVDNEKAEVLKEHFFPLGKEKILISIGG
jgi:small subunit ribosomal protein S4e